MPNSCIHQRFPLLPFYSIYTTKNALDAATVSYYIRGGLYLTSVEKSEQWHLYIYSAYVSDVTSSIYQIDRKY